MPEQTPPYGEVSDPGAQLEREATEAAQALGRLSDLAAILGEAPDPLHDPDTEPRHRLQEAADTLHGWVARMQHGR